MTDAFVERMVSYGVLGVLFLMGLAVVVTLWNRAIGTEAKPGLLVRLIERHLELVASLESVLAALPVAVDHVGRQIQSGLDRQEESIRWQEETEKSLGHLSEALRLMLSAKANLIAAQASQIAGEPQGKANESLRLAANYVTQARDALRRHAHDSTVIAREKSDSIHE